MARRVKEENSGRYIQTESILIATALDESRISFKFIFSKEGFKKYKNL
jgi:hypothetical protein